MKKYLLVLVAMLLVVTGCGSKTLTCTLEEDGQKATSVVKFDKNDVATSATQSMTLEFEEGTSEEDKENSKAYMDLLCSVMDYEGVECSTEIKSNALEVKITMDFEKMSAEDKESAGYTEEESTYDAVKKELEEQGYTCK